MKSHMTCAHCGAVKAVPPSVAKVKKYCTNKCKYEAFRLSGWPVENSTMLPCQTCGNQIKVSKSKAGTKRFCSQKCMLVWRGPVLRELRTQPEKHETKPCKWCGINFKTHSCRVAGGRGEYCSRACVGSATVASFGQSRTSKSEQLFGQALKAAGLIFTPQFRISKWCIDYWFAESRVAVEYDGDYWHSLERVKKVDAEKDEYLQSIGCKVFRIRESEVKKNPAAAILAVQAATR